MKIKIAANTLLGIVFSASTAAQAETIFLNCTAANVNPRVVTIDTANSTVDNVPATINAASIDWQKDGIIPQGAVDSTTVTQIGHIDRAAGTYTITSIVHWANGHVVQMDPTVYSCIKSEAPTTKF